jgi:hypothetical protein
MTCPAPQPAAIGQRPTTPFGSNVGRFFGCSVVDVGGSRSAVASVVGDDGRRASSFFRVFVRVDRLSEGQRRVAKGNRDEGET